MKFTDEQKAELRENLMQALDDETMEQVAAGMTEKAKMILGTCICAAGTVAGLGMTIDGVIGERKVDEELAIMRELGVINE